MIHSWFGPSWKVKIPAFTAAIALLIGQIGTVIDSDPRTVPNISLCVTQVLMIISLFQARANLVTSEQAKQGAKQKIRH